MNREQLVSDADLQTTAFDLITSSAIRRYSRLARENGERVAAELNANNVGLREIVARIQVLAQRAISAPNRSDDEVELVLLMTVMSEHSAPEVLQNLEILAARNEPPMVWVAAYARELLGALTAERRTASALATADTSSTPVWEETSVCEDDESVSEDGEPTTVGDGFNYSEEWDGDRQPANDNAWPKALPL